VNRLKKIKQTIIKVHRCGADDVDLFNPVNIETDEPPNDTCKPTIITEQYVDINS